MAKIASHRVLLIRSGQTDWDLAGRLQGSTDLPLSPAGRCEVEAEVAEFGEAGLSVVLCAPDEASQQTAAIWSKGAKVVVIPGLSEPNVGLWEGILRSELEDRYCRAGRQWGDDPSCVTPPEGESLESAAARLLPALGKALSRVKGRRADDALPAGLGLVLRPIAQSIVRCSVSDLPSSELCAMIRNRPSPEWVEFAADFDWNRPVRPRPPRPATVASVA